MWFKNSAVGIHVWKGAANFFVSNSGTMYISEVQPTDAGKKYYCVVSLADTNDAKLGPGNVPSRSSLGQWIRLSDDSFGVFYFSVFLIDEISVSIDMIFLL